MCGGILLREAVRASVEWSPETDRFVLWVDELAGRPFVPEPFGAETDSLLVEVDEAGGETGRVVGVELALLELVPELPLLFELPGKEPLPLKELLIRLAEALPPWKGLARPPAP